jgi:hypothetical protein
MWSYTRAADSWWLCPRGNGSGTTAKQRCRRCMVRQRSSEVGDERWHSGHWAAMAGVSCSAKERGRERKEWGGWPTSTVLRG